jgi:hypothetical protein
VRVLFLDVDGVLNRTGYAPVESFGLRSWIEPELAVRLSLLLLRAGARIVMSSDWRVGRTLDVIGSELKAAGVGAPVVGKTPELGGPRWREIEAWMVDNAVAREQVAIVDDGFSMGPLDDRFVRVSPLAGLDDDACARIAKLFGG